MSNGLKDATPFAGPEDDWRRSVQFYSLTGVAITRLWNGDWLYTVDTTDAARTVTLPDVADETGHFHFVKRITGGANACKVVTAAGLLDGSATHSIAAQNSILSYFSDGVQYRGLQLQQGAATANHSHVAESISYSAGGGISATNVQAAIAELDTEKLSSASAATTYSPIAHNHDAASISFSAAGSIAATTVQAALVEVDSEKLAKASNLSDLASADTARNNLDLGTAAIDHVWWTAWPTPPGTAVADPGRFGGRVFVGGAVLNDSKWWEGAPPGAPVGFTDLDWLGQLARVSYNGGAGIGLTNQSDVNYSQMVVLADHETTAITHAGPHVAITAAVQSKNCLADSSPRVFNGFAVKNTSASISVSIWCYYGEAHRVAGGTGNVYAAELEVRNSIAAVTGWTPYATSGVGTIGLDLGAGCGLSSTGQFDATAAINIHANPMKFGVGILFLDGSITTVSGTKAAIALPNDYQIQWFKSASNLAAELQADTNGNFYILTEGGEVIIDTTLSIPDDSGIRWGTPGTGDVTIVGSAANNTIIFNTNGAEISRFSATGQTIAGTLGVSATASFGGVTSFAGQATFAATATFSATAVFTTGFKHAAAWTAYTPTVTPAAGAFTSVTASAAWANMGRHVAFRAHVTIQNNGTAATGISVSLPKAPIAGAIQAASVVETGVTGYSGGARIDPTTGNVFVQRYDATYLGGTGYVININGYYEASAT